MDSAESALDGMYEAQSGLPKQKLSDAAIVLVGDDAITHFLASAFCGMGFGTTHLFYEWDDTTRTLKKNWNKFLYAFGGTLEEVLSQMNGGIRFVNHGGLYSKEDLSSLPEKPVVVIDATNNPDTKRVCLEYCVDERLPFISASSDSDTTLIQTYLPSRDGLCIGDINKNEDKANEFCFPEYSGKEQGASTSSLAAGIISAEVLKLVLANPNDDFSLRRLYFNRLSGTRAGKENDYEIAGGVEERKVAIFGAGSLGTYAAICLCLEARDSPMALYLVDFDVVELRNRNRQILYFRKWGTGPDGKWYKKVNVMAEELSRINPYAKILPLDGMVGDEETTEQTDRNGKVVRVINAEYMKSASINLIIGCLDRLVPRHILNNISMKNHVAYIDGGSGTHKSDETSVIDCHTNVKVYVPDKTPTMNQQKHTAFGAKKEKESTNSGSQIIATGTRRDGCDRELNLLPPNMIGGTLEAIETLLLLYSSGSTIVSYCYGSTDAERLVVEMGESPVMMLAAIIPGS